MSKQSSQCVRRQGAGGTVRYRSRADLAGARRQAADLLLLCLQLPLRLPLRLQAGPAQWSAQRRELVRQAARPPAAGTAASFLQNARQAGAGVAHPLAGVTGMYPIAGRHPRSPAPPCCSSPAAGRPPWPPAAPPAAARARPAGCSQARCPARRDCRGAASRRLRAEGKQQRGAAKAAWVGAACRSASSCQLLPSIEMAGSAALPPLH